MLPEEVQSWTPDHFLANQSTCQQVLLEDRDTFETIPSLNTEPLHNFRDKQLVRFRGMIQDMYNPEYYFESFEVRNVKTGVSGLRCGKYRDSADCSPDESIVIESAKNKSHERQTCVVISVPCVNDWAKEKSTNSNGSSQIMLNHGGKRTLDPDDEMDCSEPISKKPVENDRTVDTAQNSKSSGPSAGNQSLLSKDHIMNFPVPNEDGKSCIVKIYDEVSYKLNQIVDVVGFISLDPALSTICVNDETMDDVELQTHNPPASLVPRLHAIKVTELTKTGIVPASEVISKAKCIRSDLQMVLSQLLFGDVIAADYLICHLISSIYLRRDGLSLGSFPINITHFPITKHKSFPEDFYEVLALLVPKSYYLGITLDDLNNLNLTPKKDYECNRLTSGVLQLSDNTHLVVDETKLTSGPVSPNGRKNYEAIGDLVKHQKVVYDFKFYTMEFEADIPVLIFSESRSMIPCATQVVLKTDPETEKLYPEVLEATKQYLKDEERLSNIRQYLEALRHTEFQFNDEAVEVIQEDFVKMRQSDQGISADNLHSLMVLARLMSLSHGVSKLTIEHWKEALRMETERMRRAPRRNA